MSPLAISANETHVWFVAADVPPPALAALARHLSATERERAGRYRFAEDQRRSIVGRAALRLLLARYRGGVPAGFDLRAAEHGKPELVEGGIEFNASHSGDLVALAFSAAGPVGVDIEHVRRMRDALAIAERHFSGAEIARLRASGAEGGEQGLDDEFFRVWTAKEAVVKAIGRGLGAGLGTFTVAGGEGAALTAIACDADAPAGLAGLATAALPPPRSAYRAAVAAAAGTTTVVVRSAGTEEL